MSAKNGSSKNGRRQNTTWEVGLTEGAPRFVQAASMRHEDGCLILADEHGDPVFASRAAIYAHAVTAPAPAPARVMIPLPESLGAVGPNQLRELQDVVNAAFETAGMAAKAQILPAGSALAEKGAAGLKLPARDRL